MIRYRTIKGAVQELKAEDPNTEITEYLLRKLVVSGEIPSLKSGNKYIINVDELLDDIERARYKKNPPDEKYEPGDFIPRKSIVKYSK